MPVVVVVAVVTVVVGDVVVVVVVPIEVVVDSATVVDDAVVPGSVEVPHAAPTTVSEITRIHLDADMVQTYRNRHGYSCLTSPLQLSAEQDVPGGLFRPTRRLLCHSEDQAIFDALHEDRLLRVRPKDADWCRTVFAHEP